MRSPIAMISYSSKDAEAAELIHDELALRCFDVSHDQYSFDAGRRTNALMSETVQQCDVFVPYLTEHSLYLDRTENEPRPALTGELIPALERRRRNLVSGEPDRPIIVPLAHGLGSREVASEHVRRHTGEDIGSFWGTWLDQDTDEIQQSEAAGAATDALTSYLNRDPADSPLLLVVATRGDSPSSQRFIMDATRLVGGDRRPGEQDAWARILRALRDVSRVLARQTTSSAIEIDLRCHLSAAFAVGRTFHQASPWTPAFRTRHGEVSPAVSSEGASLVGGLDSLGEIGDVIVDIDMLGHGVGTLASRLASTMERLSGRLSLTAPLEQDLRPEELAAAAYDAARQVREAHAILKPPRIHLVMSTPAAFAGLLGYHMTALAAAVSLYEFDGQTYVPSLEVTASHP